MAADEGPRPSPAADFEREEIREFLETDETRLGDVYRCLQQGLNARATADALGVKSSAFVWNYSRVIKALLFRDLPAAPTVALQTAHRYRGLLKRQWSPAVRARLSTDLELLEKRAGGVTGTR